MNRQYHDAIIDVLGQFNAEYLIENRIYFGGGTRIALELNEFRTSVDIDFVCPDKASYRAVRTQVSSNSLGALVDRPLSHKREIRADRDGVRTIIESKGVSIKLEFVAFDNYQLKAMESLGWGVPVIDKESCFITKLLANADRYNQPIKKDIIDLIMMHKAWGEPSDAVWSEVDSHYGTAGREALTESLEAIIFTPSVLDRTFSVCDIKEKERIEILDHAENWYNNLLSCTSLPSP